MPTHSNVYAALQQHEVIDGYAQVSVYTLFPVGLAEATEHHTLPSRDTSHASSTSNVIHVCLFQVLLTCFFSTKFTEIYLLYIIFTFNYHVSQVVRVQHKPLNAAVHQSFVILPFILLYCSH